MRRAIWMHPVDLLGRDPEAAADDLRARGCDTVRLAVAYHGGRLTVATDDGPRIRDLAEGGLLVRVDDDGPAALRRRVDVPIAETTHAFLEAARRADLEVWGWTVLCHDDRVTRPGAADVCVTNVQGDVLPYALCPSRPAVRAYLADLCAALSRVPGLSGLDLEALGWLGVAHQSAHDKAAGPMDALTTWLLSLCTCDACTGRLGAEAVREFRARVHPTLRAASDAWPTAPASTAMPLASALDALLGADLVRHIVDARRGAARECLAAIRACTSVPLDLRLAPSPLFHGGKAPLTSADVDGLADAVTYTWLGEPLEQVVAGVAATRRDTSYHGAVHAGFTSLPPTCRNADDVERCVRAAADASLDGVSAYCDSLATRTTRAWLASAFRLSRQGVPS